MCQRTFQKILARQYQRNEDTNAFNNISLKQR